MLDSEQRKEQTRFGSFETNEIVRKIDVRGNDFSAMTFRDVSFRGGIDLSLQRLPDGADDLYVKDAANTIRQARALLLTYSDRAIRDELSIDPDVIQREVDIHDQTDVFVRAPDLEPNIETRRALTALLKSASPSSTRP